MLVTSNLKIPFSAGKAHTYVYPYPDISYLPSNLCIKKKKKKKVLCAQTKDLIVFFVFYFVSFRGTVQKTARGIVAKGKKKKTGSKGIQTNLIKKEIKSQIK